MQVVMLACLSSRSSGPSGQGRKVVTPAGVGGERTQAGVWEYPCT
jgi:hypothetical protein